MRGDSLKDPVRLKIGGELAGAFDDIFIIKLHSSDDF